ncbi:kynurenine/alpha-aminoadipate aminotransferase, mitochondrial-like [Haliotis rubra]|uniref:kynurenine/alpha-aminoadipate aminotransferase, mitochondrial-like n=1 Tax=Haliotis rubra TaxID=36100 RepID=UPI001EE5853E|nr:kynurenine/alpha-aminoadipate aminotransferase, mitochondrial-like [Haliotis rubra]
MAEGQGTACSNGQRITDYSAFFNQETRLTQPAPIWRYVEQKNKTPVAGHISFDGGFPNSIQFPLLKATLTLSDGEEVEITPSEMKATLQYTKSKGMTKISEWVMELYKRVHNPPTMDGNGLPSSLDLILTCGGRWGVVQSLKMFVEDGGCFLAEEVIYQTLSPMYLPRNIRGIAIRSDKGGMDPVHLRQVLSEWDEGSQGRRPTLMYTVPTASNPTGLTLSEQRKKDIYKVCQEFNILILEDDPYYFLQNTLIPSFLSMDTDGRVIRADSFSKTLSPGCRLGILFGPKEIVDKMTIIQHPTTGGPSSLSQVIISKVVTTWGHDKFLSHMQNVASFYKERREKLLSYMDKYLTGLCEWSPAAGGMFQWVTLLGVDKSEPVVDRLMEREVFVMDGFIFSLDRASRPNIRLSYSRITDEQMEKGISILADVLKEIRGIK